MEKTKTGDVNENANKRWKSPVLPKGLIQISSSFLLKICSIHWSFVPPNLVIMAGYTCLQKSRI